jgi:threonine dehydratase
LKDATASLDLEDSGRRIRKAAEIIRPHVRRTPTVYSHTSSATARRDVFLKLENLQRTGSFKLRGALHKLLTLDPARRDKGLIAASAGNHAQGVALAARLTGAEATVVMPVGTALIKVQRTEGYGAEVVLHGESWDDAQRRALEIARERDLTLIHPFDDRTLIEGQGTIGLEILEQVPDLDTVVVPVGGGGLIAGIALAVKALAPAVRVIGVQASGASAMTQSFQRGERVTVAEPRTIADGIRVGSVGEITFALVRELVDDMVNVEEEEIGAAVIQTMERSKVVAEAAGVVPVAALAAGRIAGGRKICAVLSGGNIDLNLLARLIESGLANAGRYHLVQIRLRDVPGQLREVLAILAERESNVVDVVHHRAGWKVPVGYVDLEILIETRDAQEGAALDEALRRRGFDVRA